MLMVAIGLYAHCGWRNPFWVHHHVTHSNVELAPTPAISIVIVLAGILSAPFRSVAVCLDTQGAACWPEIDGRDSRRKQHERKETCPNVKIYGADAACDKLQLS